MNQLLIAFVVFIVALVVVVLVLGRRKEDKPEPEERRIEDDFCPDCAGKLTRENQGTYYMCICDGARDE